MPPQDAAPTGIEVVQRPGLSVCVCVSVCQCVCVWWGVGCVARAIEETM